MDFQQENITITTDVYATLKGKPLELVAHLTNCVAEKKITVVRFYKPRINGSNVDIMCDVQPMMDCVQVFCLLQDEKDIDDKQFFSHYLNNDKVESFRWPKMFKNLVDIEFLPDYYYMAVKVYISDKTKYVLSVDSLFKALDAIACFFSKTNRQLDVFVDSEEITQDDALKLIEDPRFVDKIKKKYNVEFIETLYDFKVVHCAVESEKTKKSQKTKYVTQRKPVAKRDSVAKQSMPVVSETTFAEQSVPVVSKTTFAHIVEGKKQSSNVSDVAISNHEQIHDEPKIAHENQEIKQAIQQETTKDPEIAMLKEQIQIQMTRNVELREENACLKMALAEQRITMYSFLFSSS